MAASRKLCVIGSFDDDKTISIRKQRTEEKIANGAARHAAVWRKRMQYFCGVAVLEAGRIVAPSHWLVARRDNDLDRVRDLDVALCHGAARRSALFWFGAIE